MLLQIAHGEAQMRLESKRLKFWGGGNAMVSLGAGYVHATDSVNSKAVFTEPLLCRTGMRQEKQ